MTGMEIFEALSRMTEQERNNCFFPFYYNTESYERIRNNTLNYASNDEERDKILAVKDEKVAEALKGRYDEECGELACITGDIEDNAMRDIYAEVNPEE